MLKFLKIGADKIGIDEAIAYSIVARLIQAGGTLITLIFIAKFLTKVEQGYYYTFGSILAIQIFFELGLSNIITQFVAHENANLIWSNQIYFTGNEASSSRLSSLLRFTVKWFSAISLVLFIGLLITGYLFFGEFGKNHLVANWKIPWVILSISTSLSLLVSPILAFFEGLGKVKEVAKIRMVQLIVQLSLTILLFSTGFKLYSAPIAALVAFAIAPIWILLGSKIKMLQFIWIKNGVWKVNYQSEIFPFQWKIALSWISGYFIFQLFNPVLFATEGPVVAGQMGMTLTALNGVMSVSMSWMNTKIPLYSGLISLKNYEKLDFVFNKALAQSLLLNAFGLISLLIIIFMLPYLDLNIGESNFGDRFLPFIPTCFIAIPVLFNHIVFSWATYLRCHKKEPMLLQSVVMGFLCSISTIFFGHYFGVLGITSGYLFLNIIGFFWAQFIFSEKKKKWHKN